MSSTRYNKEKEAVMRNLREFLRPWWTKMILIVCLTVVSYASVSQTALRLNQLSKGASDVCYGPKMISIANASSGGKTKVANAINSHLVSNHSSSKFNSLTNAGMSFVESGESMESIHCSCMQLVRLRLVPVRPKMLV
jgi:hypothetical protein